MPELVVRGSSVRLFSIIFAALLPIAAVSAQTAVTYSYFAETGISYDYYGKIPASTTGFGVRIGNSDTFVVTDIDTVAHTGTSYATLRSGLEYHLAVHGNWEFIGIGSIGATTTGSATIATFAGGVAASGDIGAFLSKGRFKLPLILQYRITAITATQVKPTYGVEFRKTF